MTGFSREPDALRLDSWDPAGLEGMDAMTRYECSGFVQDVRCLELRVGKQTPNQGSVPS